MTYEEYISTILKSTPEEWLNFEEEGILTLKNDLDIWIKKIATDEKFDEEWVRSYADKNAYRVNVEFYYRNSLVEKEVFVYVDGYRAIVPLSKDRYSKKASKKDYIIAKILNQNNPNFVEERYLKEFDIIDY